MKKLILITLFSLCNFFVNADDLSININGTDVVKEIISYGNGQDIDGTATTANANKTLNMNGNTWKAIDLTSIDITPGTILEFDFSSSAEGEIHGIGFDNDLNIDASKTFKLYGTQNWGKNQHETYFLHAPEVISYRIPIGSIATGNQKYLFFVLDQDVSSPTAQMTISNIRVYKENLSVNIDGVDTVKEIVSYGNGQDIDGTATTANANKTLNMNGNTWKAIELTSIDITPGTILEFDFSSSAEGEIHGIGFDNDLNIDASKTFKLYGTQNYGINNFESYLPSAPAVKTYRIPVGSFYSGNQRYLFFTLDHDEFVPDAQMTISNIKVYKSKLSVNINGTDVEQELLSYGNNQDMESSIISSNSNKTLNITGNTWKAIDLTSINITPASTIQFSISSSSEGEIHGIGFDNDLSISPSTTFKLYGMQNWGLSDFNNYSASAPGTKSYNIPVGQFYTGTYKYLFITLDDDQSNPDAQLTISNIVITTPATYSVTFTAGANGSLTGDLNQTIIEGENATAVTAVPDADYEFDKWSDDNTSNPRTITNVTENLSFTALFKSATVTQEPVSGLILSQAFTFDQVNRRDSLTLNDGSIWQYQYDGLGNLEQAQKAHPSDPQQDLLFNYSYDDIGNRKTSSENGVGKTYTANDIQQYTEVNEDGTLTILNYDDAGNPDKVGDWNITWDGEDRARLFTNSLTGVKIEFTYDYRGFTGSRKVLDSGDNVISHVGFIYDGNLVSDEIDYLNNNKVIRSYTWGLDPAGTKQQVGGIGALLSMEETQPDNTTKTFYYVSDAGGNVTNLIESHDDGSLTMANSYEYGPFGQVVAKTENVTNPMQFNTKYTDSETGLVYYGYRFYDSADGRWLNRDPIGVDGGINVYNSVSNNMVNGFSGGFSVSASMEYETGIFDEWAGVDASGFNNKRLGPLKNMQRNKSKKSTSDIKDLTNGVRQINGFPFSVLSGDIFHSANKPSFGSKGCEFLISINGVANNHRDGGDLNLFLQESIRYKHISPSNFSFVHNPTTGLKTLILGDIFQIIGDELGTINITSQRAAKHIEAAAEQAKINKCGDCYTIHVVAHSQGTSVFYRAMHLIDKDIRKNIEFIGIGGQRFSDKSLGLKDYENYANRDDLVPFIGNYNPLRLFGIPRVLMGSEVDFRTSGKAPFGLNHPWKEHYSDVFNKK